MTTLLGVCFLIFGLFIGSFLNVVILRWGTGKTFISGRSVCVHTGKVLPWYDLIPVLSFVALGGKSRFSKEPLSIQYPFVEILTGVVFLGTYWKFFQQGLPEVTSLYVLQFLITLVVLCILIVIALYDLRTKIIPNPLVYSFIILSGIVLLMQGAPMWDVLAGPILWAPFAAMWFFSRGTWMGYGDAKFAWGMGWFLGLVLGISAVMLAFWIGAVVSLILLALIKVSKHSIPFLPRGLTIKSEVPFAPFLVLGTLLVLFFNINVLLIF